jgi:hypothetical protein
MTTLLCAAFWLLLPLTIALAVLTWLTETRDERIRRLHRSGRSQAAVARHMGITRHRVRKALA